MHLVRQTRALVLALALTGCAEAEPPAHLAIPGADAERGRVLIASYGCGACHTVEGVRGANGIVGPRLENFAKRTLLAGTYPNVPRFLVPWLMGPPDLKPGTAMPDLGVSDGEARDIASYLYTLGSGDLPPRAEAAVTETTGETFEALRKTQLARLRDGDSPGIEAAIELVASGSAQAR